MHDRYAVRDPVASRLVLALGEKFNMAAGISELLASAFSAQLDSTVHVATYDKYKEAKEVDGDSCYFQPALDIDRLFNVSHLCGNMGKFGDKATVFSVTPPFDIYVNTLTGKTLTIRGVVENETVGT